ncbi:hypothetical protein ES703_92988 [subsurface metagenome]
MEHYTSAGTLKEHRHPKRRLVERSKVYGAEIHKHVLIGTNSPPLDDGVRVMMVVDVH